jgi:hypothetical protein
VSKAARTKPGRKPRGPKGTNLNMRATAEERARWDALAASRGLDTSTLVRRLLDAADPLTESERAELVELRRVVADLRRAIARLPQNAIAVKA